MRLCNMLTPYVLPTDKDFCNGCVCRVTVNSCNLKVEARCKGGLQRALLHTPGTRQKGVASKHHLICGGIHARVQAQCHVAATAIAHQEVDVKTEKTKAPTCVMVAGLFVRHVGGLVLHLFGYGLTRPLMAIIRPTWRPPTSTPIWASCNKIIWLENCTSTVFVKCDDYIVVFVYWMWAFKGCGLANDVRSCPWSGVELCEHLSVVCGSLHHLSSRLCASIWL